MADNVAITAGAGTAVGTDDISSVQYQRVKLIQGADGTNDGDVAKTAGLSVKDVLNTIDFGGSATATLFDDVSAVGTFSAEIACAGGNTFMVRSEFKTTASDSCRIRVWFKCAHATETWSIWKEMSNYTVNGSEIADLSGPDSAATLEQTGSWFFGDSFPIDCRGWTTICLELVNAPTTGVSMWGDLV